MLEKLLIKNVALIEESEIDFGKGLNILSGETGSGKSIILDSINFVLGAKADRSMVRYGENECSVIAVFRPDTGDPVYADLAALDLATDEEIIISRKYRMDGRGDIRINGTPVNVSMLRRITSHLVDVHGQSEHFYLLSESNQLTLLDKAAGEALQAKKAELSALLVENKEKRAKLRALGGDEAERGRRLDILKYQIDEIDRADLSEGEEEELLSKRFFYANIEKIMRALSEAAERMNGDGGAIDNLNGTKRTLSDISNLDGEYASIAERLDSILAEAEDIGATLASLNDNLSFNEEDFQEVENRLDIIRSLKKKYGDRIEKILAYRIKAGEEYDLLLHSDEEAAVLNDKNEKNLLKIYEECKALTKMRKDAAQKFCSGAEEELHTLNIKNASFCVKFNEYTRSDAAKAGENGLDEICFLFSANAGEPLKPLSKVISGGEMSRLMLAIKTRMSDINHISTYIFDEIDAGISGATAKTVSEKFADISKNKQIIAVSHLAQIVAMGDNNFLISKKEEEKGKTVTEIKPLSKEEKRHELVRLLGGNKESEAAMTLAKELLESSESYKIL